WTARRLEHVVAPPPSQRARPPGPTARVPPRAQSARCPYNHPSSPKPRLPRTVAAKRPPRPEAMQGGRSTRWQDGTSRLPVPGCPETASADPTDDRRIRCQLALRRSSASTSARPAPRACWSPWTAPSWMSRSAGMGPCAVLTDEHGDPVRPAILYGVDTRAEDQIVRLTAQLGAEEILARGSCALSSQAAGPKVAWVAQHEPEAYARARRLFMPA